MNGEADTKVEEFLSAEHSLAEYKELIESYKQTASEITGLNEIVWFDMFQLDCNDIKHGLSSKAHELATRLVTCLAQKHLDENKR